jgi:hypothetical protein
MNGINTVMNLGFSAASVYEGKEAEIAQKLVKLREMEEICWGTFTEMPNHKSFSTLEKQFSVMVNVRAQIRILKSLLEPSTSIQP